LGRKSRNSNNLGGLSFLRFKNANKNIFSFSPDKAFELAVLFQEDITCLHVATQDNRLTKFSMNTKQSLITQLDPIGQDSRAPILTRLSVMPNMDCIWRFAGMIHRGE
jgi:hypothetical protein